MTIITKNDFVGNVKISQNTKETNDLELYIERNTKNTILDLLGDFQYKIYNNNIDKNKYEVLTLGKNENVNEFYYYKDDVLVLYFGLKECIKYFTYWDYVRNLNPKTTSVGIKFPDSENSKSSTQIQVNNVIEQRYNLGVDEYKKASDFINDLCDIKLYFDEIINNGDDTFTIIIKQIEGKNSLNLSTILDINEKFKLDKIEYKVKELLFAQNQDNILTSCLLKFDELVAKLRCTRGPSPVADT